MAFWAAFYDWHIRTEHEWDVALHLDAMAMGLDGISRQIGEALLPAITKAAESMRELLKAVSA